MVTSSRKNFDKFVICLVHVVLLSLTYIVNSVQVKPAIWISTPKMNACKWPIFKSIFWCILSPCGQKLGKISCKYKRNTKPYFVCTFLMKLAFGLCSTFYVISICIILPSGDWSTSSSLPLSSVSIVACIWTCSKNCIFVQFTSTGNVSTFPLLITEGCLKYN